MAKDRDEDQATPEERARAQALARLTDAMLAGAPTPPALPEDRALLETATVIHAAMRGARLELGRRAGVIDAAFAEVKQPHKGTIPFPTEKPARRTSRRMLRHAPWVVAALSAAAALFLWLRPPDRQVTRTQPHRRRADMIIGPITRGNSGDFTARIDRIFADRRAVYREGLGVRQ